MGIFVLIWVIGFAFVVCGLIASIYTLVKGIERHETGIIVWGAVGTACGVLGIFFAGIVFGTISLICGLYGKSLLDKTGDNPSFEQYKREQAMKNDPQYQAYLRSIGQAPAARRDYRRRARGTRQGETEVGARQGAQGRDRTCRGAHGGCRADERRYRHVAHEGEAQRVDG